MSVCTTCLKPDLPADGRHDCPGLGDIQLTRQLGRGLRVDTAPARARMALTVLADHGYGLAMVGDDQINIADQVLYQVVGYDPESAALVLELVEDWRPGSAPDGEDEEPTGPAKPGIPRCTATLETEHQGIAHCWRAATHNQREGYETHMGEAEHGYRFQWIGTEPGATPHQPGPEPADANVCTPIPAETLMQMSEVSPEQQLGRPENALERLRLAREALIRDGYFSADEVGPDVAPRIVEWLSHHRQQLEQARADARTLGASVQEWHDTAVRHQHWGQRRWNAWKSARARAQRLKAELDRLTAGEEPGWDPMLVPTPGQLIARWNSCGPIQRLARAQGVIEAAETANRCHFEGHRQRLEEDRQAWVALARVRDVLADMERITGARHWARILRKAVDGDSGAEDATVTCPEPCAAVHPVDPSARCDKPGGHDDGEHGGETNYLYRLNWPAEPTPLTDADGRVICTCTHDTPCGCGTSVHYASRKEATS